MFNLKVSPKYHIPLLGILLFIHFTTGNVIPEEKPDVDESTPLIEVNYDFGINSSEIVPDAVFASIEIYVKLHDDVECEQILPKEHFEKYKKLGIFAYEGLTTLADLCLKELKPSFAKVIMEVSREESLKEYIANFTKLQKDMFKVAGSNNTFDKFDTLHEVVDLLDKYNLTLNKNPSKETELIANIITKNDLAGIFKAIDEIGVKFAESFKSKVEEYKSSLTSDERANDKAFDDWYTKLQNEKTIPKRIQLFDNFLELYCLDKS